MSLGHFIIIHRLKTRRWEGGIKLERGVGSIVYRTINSRSINPALVPVSIGDRDGRKKCQHLSRRHYCDRELLKRAPEYIFHES